MNRRDKAAKKEYYRKYRLKNRDKLNNNYHRTERRRIYHIKYHKLHPEKRKIYNDRYWLKNKDIINKKRKEIQAANREVFKVKRTEYFKLPFIKSKVKAYNRRYLFRQYTKWSSMHLSTKAISLLEKLIRETNQTEPIGATDLRYLDDFKLRLTALKIVARNWENEDTTPRDDKAYSGHITIKPTSVLDTA